MRLTWKVRRTPLRTRRSADLHAALPKLGGKRGINAKRGPWRGQAASSKGSASTPRGGARSPIAFLRLSAVWATSWWAEGGAGQPRGYNASQGRDAAAAAWDPAFTAMGGKKVCIVGSGNWCVGGGRAQAPNEVQKRKAGGEGGGKVGIAAGRRTLGPQERRRVL